MSNILLIDWLEKIKYSEKKMFLPVKLSWLDIHSMCERVISNLVTNQVADI